jgi:hypothetical protein
MTAQSARSLVPVVAVLAELSDPAEPEAHVALGDVLASVVRTSDVVAAAAEATWGVLLFDIEPGDGELVAGKLLDAARGAGLRAGFGVAAHPFHAFDAAALLQRAAGALALAQVLGGDRVEVATAPVADDARQSGA